MITPELRQMRYVIEVAEHRSFSRAADRLHVAQQALSQQIKTVEAQLGLQLFRRTNRGVELTPAGVVFVQEARRVISAADRAVSRTQAVASGEAGTLRIAYTLATVYDTLPMILERAENTREGVKCEPREVFGGEIAQLLADGRVDIALCPRTAFPREYRRQEVRREPFVAAVGTSHRLASRDNIDLGGLAAELFELWPRDMAPGYYDAVIAACREAGFEPHLDEHAAGSTVWGNIARGRGVGLVVSSLIEQLPPGIALLPVGPPQPVLILDLVWHPETASPAIRHLLDAAEQLARERRWTAVT